MWNALSSTSFVMVSLLYKHTLAVLSALPSLVPLFLQYDTGDRDGSGAEDVRLLPGTWFRTELP